MLSADQRDLLRAEIDRRRRHQLGILSPEHDLRVLLAVGPRDATDVVRSMREAGYTLSAIRKAASKLRVDQRAPTWALPTATERLCDECETPFSNGRADARFCSPRCRVASHRRTGQRDAE